MRLPGTPAPACRCGLEGLSISTRLGRAVDGAPAGLRVPAAAGHSLSYTCMTFGRARAARRPRCGSAAPPPAARRSALPLIWGACRGSCPAAPLEGGAPPADGRPARMGRPGMCEEKINPFYGKSGLEGRRRLHVSKRNTCSDEPDFVTRRGLAAGGHSGLAAVTGATARTATGSGTGGFSQFGACLARPGASPYGHGVGDGRIRPALCDRNGRAPGHAPPRPGPCPARP